MQTAISGINVSEISACLGSWYQPLRNHVYSMRENQPLQQVQDNQVPIECQFRERFLQILWNEQRLRGPLRTVDGQELSIVSPGTWNVGKGPDFKNAVLRLGGLLQRGAVEVHRSRQDWYRHGHALDPAYAEVILHVVWYNDGKGEEGTPCFIMSRFLDQSLRTLLEELRIDRYPYARQVAPGACAVKWAMADDNTVQRLLRVAGLGRFEDKVLRCRRRALAVGTDQALYEALFEALGYTANRKPFQALAKGVPLAHLAELPDDLSREAVLFGSAGLLPDPSIQQIKPRWQRRIHALWDQWWRYGPTALNLTWNRAGTRPFNSPERRLAAGIELLQRSKLRLADWLRNCLTKASDGHELLSRLRQQLTFPSPWEAAHTFTTDMKTPGILLGQSRLRDIIINVILPFLCAHAEKTNNPELSNIVRQAYLEHPVLQHNRMLEEARHRFLVPPSRSKSLIRRACEQQGLLEIYRSFCGTLHGDCENCPFVLCSTVDQSPSTE